MGLDVVRLDIASNHERDHAVVADLFARQLPRIATVAETDDPIGTVTNLPEPVGNVDHADILCAQFPDEGEQPFGLRKSEAGCWLIHNDQPRTKRESLRYLHQLLFGKREAIESRRGRDIKPEAFQVGGGIGVDFLPIDQTERCVQGFTTQKNIARDIEVIEHVEFLVDEGDAEPHRVRDVTDLHRSPIHLNLPGIGFVHAAENFHQRGFAGAVFP